MSTAKPSPRRSTAASFRRSFVARLGLGAGAWLLSPLVRGLEREARGATVGRKRLVLVAQANGWGDFDPPEHTQKKLDALNIRGTFETRDYTLPSFAAPLVALRERMLLVRGMSNVQKPESGHTLSYAAFNCVPNVGAADEGGPAAATVDQLIAQRIGRETAVGGVYVGVYKPNTKLKTGNFASGRGQPVPIQCDPLEAYKTYLGGAAASTMMAAPGRSPFAKRRLLLAAAGEDVKRVATALAGRERQKLDEYVASLASLEARLAANEAAAAKGSCGVAPPAASAGGQNPEDVTLLHFDIMTAALTCGVTNVAVFTQLGLATYYKRLGGPTIASLHGVGHGHGDGVVPPGIWTKIRAFHAEQIARLAKGLEATREGDRSLLDDTAIVWLNDNGDTHHAIGRDFPAVIIGNAGGGLKTDGRFIRFAPRGAPDLYCALLQNFGASWDGFGKGNEAVKGPPRELI